MMQSLELKIPPPLVALSMSILMWVAARAVPSLDFGAPGRRVIATAVAAAGVGFAVTGVTSFRRARTTVNPLKPESASALVTSGVYRISRNPMYVGLSFVLLGWAVLLSNVLAFAILPGFILYMNRFQIRPEEVALQQLFGEGYSTYRARVRRWL